MGSKRKTIHPFLTVSPSSTTVREIGSYWPAGGRLADCCCWIQTAATKLLHSVAMKATFQLGSRRRNSQHPRWKNSLKSLAASYLSDASTSSQRQSRSRSASASRSWAGSSCLSKSASCSAGLQHKNHRIFADRRESSPARYDFPQPWRDNEEPTEQFHSLWWWR